ncbi:related to enoyl-CoA-hydratase [Melanopsichium pennsylvanicum]|uniref:3-hydroxyisobutyryl-CoA hydrolase n=2 Tax=Melanopsichium pennsylvanicum TaxID=63383 RepID=A0AAJ5C840_9BASI|nr:related to enoyl-CoA-hydratase [Melanopsichium pennsylvanicum 4]SNX87193.1 related to enoyl-CoA-hydratase [Melanopsichium pennsylvanicum]
MRTSMLVRPTSSLLARTQTTAAASASRRAAPALASGIMSNKNRTTVANSRLNAISCQMSTSHPAAMSASALTRASGASSMNDEKLVKLLSEGGLRTILLHREKALNALNQEMVDLINAALDECVRSSTCNVILLRGVGRALCSGGDVLAVVKAADSSDPKVRDTALDFFRTEFQLDYKIARLGEAANAHSAGKGAEDARTLTKSKGGELKNPKTFVSVMDGITMGGGVGLSVHAPFRIATERTMFAMPETGIGYFPDVGVTRVLARLDGRIGQYLGMTGARITGEEAYLIGLATHYVPSSSIDAIAHRLGTLPAESALNPSLVSSALQEFSGEPLAAKDTLAKSAFFGDRRIALDYIFGQLSCESIFSCLEEISSGNKNSQAAAELAQLGLSSITPEVSAWAAQTLKDIKTKSPRSLKITHQAILEARRFDVEEAFRFDMRLATAFCDLSIGRDFYNGVTHVLERDPATGKRRSGIADWEPASLDKVSDTQIRAQFFSDLETAKKAGLQLSVPELPEVSEPPTSAEARQARDSLLRGKGPLKWEQSHNVFALPSEAECAALLEGSHPAAAAVKPDANELVDTLKRHKGSLPGLQFKVLDWIKRQERRQA